MGNTMQKEARALTKRSDHGRYVELDALRGIAAMTVVLHHFAKMYDYVPNWRMSWLFAGHEAVILFFTLSGFVLSLPFWNKGENGPYIPYVIRRFFRIYVPYFVAGILALVGARFFLHSNVVANDWFRHTWQNDLTPAFIMRQVFMTGGSALNTAFWSLGYEMQMSLIFPLLLLFLRACRPLGAILMVFGIQYLSIRLGAYRATTAFQPTLQYGSMFLFGAVVAYQRGLVRRVWERTPKIITTAFTCTSAAMYFQGIALADKIHKTYFGDFIVAAGAAGIIVAVLYAKPLRLALQTPIPDYLGRISYSMYLVHGTILFVLVNLLYRRLPAIGVFALYFVTTMLITHTFCLTIEEPSLRLGKRFAMRWRGGKVSAVH